MDYINQIFSRMDLQHIRAFLINGTDTPAITNKSYRERLEAAQQPIVDFLHGTCPEKTDPPGIDALYEALSASQDIYMEIGMQAGAILMTQLLGFGHKNGRD